MPSATIRRHQAMMGRRRGFNPASIAGLALWFKADSLAGLADGDPVATWVDSSGNARDATQATSGSRPTYQTNELNGLPVVRFDGSNDHLTTAAFTNPSEWTIFAVARSTGGSYPQSIVDADGPAPRLWQFRYENAASFRGIALNGGSALIDSTPTVAPEHRVLTLRRPAGSVEAFDQGVSDGATASALAVASGSRYVRLGAYGPLTPSQYLNGDIAEVLYYDTALSTANRTTIEDYLRSKWLKTQFVSDAFVDANTTALASHTGELGATWTKHPDTGYAAADHLVWANRIRTNNGAAAHYASGIPVSADYDVEAPMIVLTAAGCPGIAGRMDTTADTMYAVDWQGSGGNLRLVKIINGTLTSLDSYALAAGGTKTIKLQMRGTALKVFVDGAQVISVTDSSITAAGRAGIRGAINSGTGTGIHLGSFIATNA